MIDAPAGGPRTWLAGSHSFARAGRLNGLLALLFFVFAGGSEATARSLTAPDHIELHSNVLGEERSVEVWLPENYDETASKKYDVLYVLDGEWDTQTCRNIDGYLVAIGFAPEKIIVSLPNRYDGAFNSRDRDFTPTVTALPKSGGADRFLRFFREELRPLLEKKYRTSGYNLLVGSSLGGLFGMYSLLVEPRLFNAVLVSDPALWYDNYYVLQLAKKRLAGSSDKNAIFYIGGRAGNAAKHMGTAAMQTLLRSLNLSSLTWEVGLYEDETHGSSVFKGNYDGIKFAYKGYSRDGVSFKESVVRIMEGTAVTLHMDTDHRDVRVTRGDRNQFLEKVESTMVVAAGESVRARSFSTSGRFDYDIPLKIETGRAIGPAKESCGPDEGLSYSFVEGDWSDFSDSKAVSDDKSKKFDASFKDHIRDLKNGALLITGYVPIPRDGYYVIQITTQPGTKVFLNEKQVLDYDPTVGSRRVAALLPLHRGCFSLRVEYLHHQGVDLDFDLFDAADGQVEWWNSRLPLW